jgi:hypothetical protein
MATLNTLAAAEDRCRSQMEAHTWIVVFAARAFTGAGYVCRFLRPMTTAFTQGGWDETTDDTVD